MIQIVHNVIIDSGHLVVCGENVCLETHTLLDQDNQVLKERQDLLEFKLNLLARSSSALELNTELSKTHTVRTSNQQQNVQISNRTLFIEIE